MTAQTAIRPLGEPGDLGWVIKAHGEVYAREYGWDTSFEALVARIAADYAAGPGQAGRAAWIAEFDGRRAGCVFCVPAGDDPAVAQLRLLLTLPSARGQGLGATLVRTCMDFARQAGYPRMRLWTQDVLAAACRIYQASGFTLIAEQPHRSFGADLVGQTYQAELAGPADPAG
ncbi:MAG TPA: GNAT family N-acetyltransferase [Streptosporangiaceae bacterium]|jgi:GNAT superfamily N-acetyltransferase|nr:GNAT family N-acetyltransferase [Streptosporangiaceae bacterium]